MSKTKIEWATDVWNPTVGCTKVSAGCKNCYAERIFERFHPDEKFSNVKCYPERLDQPTHWRNPRKVFVDSMSDLFHEDVPFEFIDKVFAVMALVSKHTYMILTKRPERMLKYLNDPYRFSSVEASADIYLQEKVGLGTFLDPREWPLPNVWLGVSVENQAMADERILLLLQTPAKLRFVSVEPMLGLIDISKYLEFDYSSPKVRWVICGCESGPRARPMEMDWVRSLHDQCKLNSRFFFLKQMMIDRKLVKMPGLDGNRCADYPLDQRINV
jgi:protein gp37